MTNDDYFGALILQFPFLKSSIQEEDPEMTHMRMEHFATYTITQIQNNHVAELQKCFAFQESKIDFMNPELKNALEVSYCESLLLEGLGDTMHQAVLLMPPKLKAVYTGYEQWYQELCRRSTFPGSQPEES